MNREQLESLLKQVIAALESSFPITPKELPAHWQAWNAAQEALRTLQESANTGNTK